MAAYNITANFASSSTAPLYPQAILFPLFAFPSWLLCVPSLVWHFSQGNIAAGSVVTWVVLNNFYNAINPLIWPRDNLTEWWDGNLWCDIGIRIQVGTNVGIAASTVMIIRKLARVMDTRNIIVSSSRNSKVKEKIWEVVWCWGFPMLMILLFYIVQPIRYFIFGIMGCISAYDTSWPSIVLIIMWAPITMLVAAYYAGEHFFLHHEHSDTTHPLPSPPHISPLHIPSRVPPPHLRSQYNQISFYQIIHPLHHHRHCLPPIYPLSSRPHVRHHPQRPLRLGPRSWPILQ